MQYSIHPPSPFIQRHQPSLLPSWSQSVASVVILLQPCACDLSDRSSLTEQWKQRLRSQVLALGGEIVEQIRAEGYLAELFDPRTGWPLEVSAGKLPLDDVAVAQACLGYPIVCTPAGCKVLLHPEWGNAVYPATLLTSASPAITAQAIARAQTFSQWQPPGNPSFDGENADQAAPVRPKASTQTPKTHSLMRRSPELVRLTDS